MLISHFFYTLQSITIPNANPAIRVFFTPRHENNKKINEEVVDIINNCRRTFYGAIYTFTDKSIALALIEAKKRGVDVSLVADKYSADSRYGQLARLRNAGISVYVYQNKIPLKGGWSGPLMHHKFFVCDQPALPGNTNPSMIVATGSWNWTNAASNVNCENFLIMKDQSVVKTFLDEFAYLKTRSITNFNCHEEQERLAMLSDIKNKNVKKLSRPQKRHPLKSRLKTKLKLKNDDLLFRLSF